MTYLKGQVSYEVHGLAQYSDAVYGKLCEVGAAYGLEKLGYYTYQCNHTENGFPQIGEHFTYPFKDEPEFQDYCKQIGFFADPDNWPLHGSVSHDLDKYFCNPFEVGWEHMVKFDHDFHGRAALEEIARDHRRMVTLVWDADDVLDVFASYLKGDEEPYKEIRFPYDREENNYGTSVDEVVDAEGCEVGRSMFPVYTLYYRKLISLCPIDASLAEEGTEVRIVWGEPGMRQKLIRATVARFPYLDLPMNAKYPVDQIPRYGA